MTWVDIEGYEGVYQVNEQGDIKRLENPPPPCRKMKEKILKPWKDKDGYANVSLSVFGSIRKFKVHQIVMKAFIGNAPEGMEVNHKNGIRDDNRLENLEYLTHKDNEKHAREVLGKKSKGAKGSRNRNAKLSENDVVNICKLLDAGEVSQPEIGAMYKVNANVISKINVGKSWNHITGRMMNDRERYFRVTDKE